MRIFLYGDDTLVIVPTVKEEYLRIRRPEDLEAHKLWNSALIPLETPKDSAQVTFRASEFAKFHSGTNDCKILAEAECLEHKALLTYDSKMLKTLGNASDLIAVRTASDHWSSLGIPKGETPKLTPQDSNPLSNETWLKW